MDKLYGVWDKEFEDWDSGPHKTIEAATRHTYVPALKPGDDPAKYRASKSLVIREWLKRGEPGDEI